MKVVIWLCCLFVASVIVTALKWSGIVLGGIPTVILYGITFWAARALCKQWDSHKDKGGSNHED